MDLFLCSVYDKSMRQPKIYRSFQELLATKNKENPEGVCFTYRKGTGVVKITNAYFYRDVMRLVEFYKKDGSSAKAIIYPLSYQLISHFFASVISGKRTIIIDSMLPLETIILMIKAAEIDSFDTEQGLFETDEENKLTQSLCPLKSVNANMEGDIIFFTSGTASFSKAVVLDSTRLLRSAYNGQSRLSCGDGDTVLLDLPLSHVFGFVCGMLWPLTYGAVTAIGSGYREVGQDMAVLKPTILSEIPSIIYMLLKFKAFNPELKVVLVGGAPISKEALNAISALKIGVSFGYGLTETSSGVAISVNRRDPFQMEICPDVKVRINGDGEVLLSTPTLMKGYYKNEAATKAAIENGWLHTNDLGFIDSDGCLNLIGRKNDVIVLENGLKVNLEEWERELIPLLPLSDFALVYQDRIIKLAIFDQNIQDEDIQKALNTFNGKKAFGEAISSYYRLNSPVPRTLTGKIKRYQL